MPIPKNPAPLFLISENDVNYGQHVNPMLLVALHEEWQIPRAINLCAGAVLKDGSENEVDIHKIMNWMNANTQPYETFWITTNLEGWFTQALQPGNPEATHALNEEIKFINYIRSVRPGALISRYDLHSIPYWYETEEDWDFTVNFMAPLWDVCDWIAPSLYYTASERCFSSANEEDWVTDKMAAAQAVAKGKPIYPFTTHRIGYEPCVNAPTYGPLTEEEIDTHLSSLFRNGADGIAWWGADQWYRTQEGWPADESQEDTAAIQEHFASRLIHYSLENYWRLENRKQWQRSPARPQFTVEPNPNDAPSEEEYEQKKGKWKGNQTGGG